MILSFTEMQFLWKSLVPKTVHVLKKGSFFNLNTINIIIIMNVYVYLLFLRRFTCFWYVSLILLSEYLKIYFGLIWEYVTRDVDVYINTDVIIGI